MSLAPHFGFGELVVAMLVMLALFGPRDLPRYARMAAALFRRLQLFGFAARTRMTAMLEEVEEEVKGRTPEGGAGSSARVAVKAETDDGGRS